MANVVDELVTKYTLDPDGYNKGGNVVLGVTHSVATALKDLGASVIGGVTHALSGMFSPIAAIAGGAGLLSMGRSAVNAAIGFDTIQRSLQAVTKDAERAKAVLAFDDKLAGPSIFTSEELAQASLTLEAFKLKTEEFLPVAEKLGTVFGGNSEALRQYVDALGYIKNGRFGEGFESLSRAGLSKDDFTAKGLTFDKSGAFTGQADQALKAIEQLVNDRFGKLSEEMANGPAAKLASVMDAIGRAARVAGQGILSVLMPAAEKIGGFIQHLVDSGAIDKAVNGIARLFNGNDIGDGTIHMIALLVSTLQNLPTVFLVVRQAVGSFFDFLKQNFETIGALMIAAFSFGPILEGIGLLIAAMNKLRTITTLTEVVAVALKLAVGTLAEGAKVVAAIGAAAIAGYAAMRLMDNIANQAMDTGPLQQLTGLWDTIQKGASAIEHGGNAPGPTGTASTIANMAANIATQQLSLTNQIAANTAKTAKNTELQSELNRKILGGGDLGRLGVTAVEMSGIKRGGRGRGLEDAIRHLVDEIAGSMQATHNSAMTNRARMDH